MSLTDNEKKILAHMVKKAVGGCEKCKKDLPLEPHRIKRGYAGGEYVPRNIMMLCNKCHKSMHELEPMGHKG